MTPDKSAALTSSESV